ncbi:MAG: DUF4445 domain-containing protein [Planctomycetes bacterium]|nr:DUF4445 domain-containing protein [Planctomycetota bacterium]
MKHFTITFEPDGKQISIHSGATLLEAAGQAGIILNSVCGGTGICKKCIVALEPDDRLVQACQYRVESDLTVTIPPESRFFEQRILQHGVDAQIDVRPTVYKKYQGGDAAKKVVGLAVDIGTTTVVAKLLDMADCREIATAAALNPQSRFGDDVISRITFAQSDEKLAELHETIINCINQLIAQLCSEAGAETSDIYEMCVVGNTTMNHIFLKLPIAQLGQAPYKASSLDAHDVRPEELGLKINPAGNVHTLENVAGFVGSDTTAVALAVDIASAEQMTLVVDIGTNGEVVLGTIDKLYAASCAAGPAFEGARITCGSRAAQGAIEAIVRNEDDIDIDVIGDCPARTICGSGLIDAVAVLLESGIIDATGRFIDREKLKPTLLPPVDARLIENDGQPAFILARPREQGAKQVILTQKDIRETQLAKGAIRTGIKLLQKKLGVEDADIARVYLAGAFGNYISPANAAKIGLLPGLSLDRVRSVGNAAVAGAQMALISQQCRDAAGEVARRIEYVEIAHEPDFQDVFADCMLF